MTAIELHNICYSFGNKRILDDVSFSVKSGVFCGLFGHNGAGKSTLFHLLVGLLVPETGSVFLNGLNLKTHALSARQNLGVVFQESTLDLDLTLLQNLEYFGVIYGLSGKKLYHRIENVLQQFSLTEQKHEKVRILNGGHKRRLELARVLLHKPKILLLDEPTAGLDRQSREELTRHVHDLAKTGVSVLWITHFIEEINSNDQLIVLQNGTVKSFGLLSDLGGHDAVVKSLNR